MVAISDCFFSPGIHSHWSQVWKEENWLGDVMEQLLTRWDVFPIPHEFKGLYYKRHSGGSAWTETRVEQMADDTVKIDFSPPESKCQQIQKKKKKSREEVGKKKNRPKSIAGTTDSTLRTAHTSQDEIPTSESSDRWLSGYEQNLGPECEIYENLRNDSINIDSPTRSRNEITVG